MQVLPSQDWEVSTSEFGRLLEGVVGRGADQCGMGRAAARRLWGDLVEGGWLEAAKPSSGSSPMSLVDLSEIARVWGQYLVPAPFVPSLLARRWDIDAEFLPDQAFTVAVKSMEGSLVPFAGWPGVAWVDAAGSELAIVSPVLGTVDEYAPSLALMRIDSEGSCLRESQKWDLATMWAAEALGGAEFMFAQALEYAKTRKAYGNLIGSYQAVAYLLAEMHRDLEFGRSATLAGAHRGPDGWIALQLASDYAVSILKRVIQVYGGIGYTWELGVHWYLRHSVALRELVRSISVDNTGTAVRHAG